MKYMRNVDGGWRMRSRHDVERESGYITSVDC